MCVIDLKKKNLVDNVLGPMSFNRSLLHRVDYPNAVNGQNARYLKEFARAINVILPWVMVIFKKKEEKKSKCAWHVTMGTLRTKKSDAEGFPKWKRNRDEDADEGGRIAELIIRSRFDGGRTADFHPGHGVWRKNRDGQI